MLKWQLAMTNGCDIDMYHVSWNEAGKVHTLTSEGEILVMMSVGLHSRSSCWSHLKICRTASCKSLLSEGSYRMGLGLVNISLIWFESPQDPQLQCRQADLKQLLQMF